MNVKITADSIWKRYFKQSTLKRINEQRFFYSVYSNMRWMVSVDSSVSNTVTPQCHNNEHIGRDKMDAIFQTTCSNAFHWIKMYRFQLRFHWSLLPRVQLTIFQRWFREWFGAGQATTHYLNQWLLVYWRISASSGLTWQVTSHHRHGVTNHRHLDRLINYSLFMPKRNHQSSALWILSDRWIPLTKGRQRGKRFHVMRSSCTLDLTRTCI